MSWATWNSTEVKNLVDAIDFGLGAVGFVLTLAGIYFGYRKLQKVQTAAMAASIAAEEIKQKLKMYNASVELASAINLMKSIMEHIDCGRLSDAIRLYDDARIHYIRGSNAIEISDDKLAGKAKKLDGQMQKSIQILREADEPINNVVRNGAMSNASQIRDSILAVQMHHEQGIA